MPDPARLAALRARYANDKPDDIRDPALRRAAEAAFNTQGNRPGGRDDGLRNPVADALVGK